nr:hypothetical protein [Tanacetum cinerariifolium]
KVGASKRIESSDDIEDVFNQGRMIDDLDKDEGIKLVKDADIAKTEGRHAAKQAKKHAEIYHLDLDHPSKVLRMKKRPHTESEACKNMMIYLKNTAGYKMDFFKGMSYDEICLIFQARVKDPLNKGLPHKTAQELWAAILKTFGDNEATKKTKKNLLKQHISQDTACAYIASQSSGSQIKFKDINQIDEDDMEEMDIKWNMALLSMRADRECRASRSQDKGKRDNYRQRSKVEEHNTKALMEIDGVGWDWSFMANEQEDHALVADKEAPIEFALMAKTSADSEIFDNSLCSKNCKKNTESLNSKITDLTDKLCDNKNMLFHYKADMSQVEDLDSLLESQRLDKNKEGLGYSAVPPSYLSLFSSQEGFVKLSIGTQTTTIPLSDIKAFTAIESTSNDAQNRNPFVPEIEASPSTISSKSFIKFVKAADSLTVAKSDKKETVRKPS